MWILNIHKAPTFNFNWKFKNQKLVHLTPHTPIDHPTFSVILSLTSWLSRRETKTACLLTGLYVWALSRTLKTMQKQTRWQIWKPTSSYGLPFVRGNLHKVILCSAATTGGSWFVFMTFETERNGWVVDGRLSHPGVLIFSEVKFKFRISPEKHGKCYDRSWSQIEPSTM